MQIGRSSPGLYLFTMCCVVADMVCFLDLWIEDEFISIIRLSYTNISIFILTFDYLRRHVQLLYFDIFEESSGVGKVSGASAAAPRKPARNCPNLAMCACKTSGCMDNIL